MYVHACGGSTSMWACVCVLIVTYVHMSACVCIEGHMCVCVLIVMYVHMSACVCVEGHMCV